MPSAGRLRISFDYDESFLSLNKRHIIVLYSADNVILKIFNKNLDPREGYAIDLETVDWHGTQYDSIRALGKYIYAPEFSSLRASAAEKIKKYIRVHTQADKLRYQYVSIDDDDPDFVFCKLVNSSKNLVGSYIYVANPSKLRGGRISFYNEEINESSLVHSMTIDNIGTLPNVKFMSKSEINLVSSDPYDCEYKWEPDEDCVRESTNSSNYVNREILRIVDTARNGGIPCKVVDYGDVRYSSCTP